MANARANDNLTPLTALKLPVELERDVRMSNPWWQGQPRAALPATRRLLVGMIQCRLDDRLAPIVVVRGPWQIGKTTAQLQIIEDMLSRGVQPERILCVQFDETSGLEKFEEPILRIADWRQEAILKRTLNQAARAGQPAYLFFDEVQNLKGWAPQFKALVDSSTVQVVVTGAPPSTTESAATLWQAESPPSNSQGMIVKSEVDSSTSCYWEDTWR